MAPLTSSQVRELMPDVQRVEEQGTVVLGMLERRLAELERPRPWWERLLMRLGL